VTRLYIQTSGLSTHLPFSPFIFIKYRIGTMPLVGRPKDDDRAEMVKQHVEAEKKRRDEERRKLRETTKNMLPKESKNRKHECR